METPFKTKKQILLFITFLCISSLLGSAIFALKNHWIILNFPSPKKETKLYAIPQNKKAHTKKEFKLFLPRQKNKHETCSHLLRGIPEQDAYIISSAWLAKVNEEGLLPKKTTIQSVSLTKSKQTLIISFDRPPFNKQAAINNKLLFLESLSKTIKTELPNIHTILWLVHHKPLNDYHFSTKHPWPINGFPPTENKTILKDKPLKKETLTIMLDPAGDAAHKGRLIDGTFERGITLQCAELLKKELQKTTPHRIILTRFPGETIEPLQNATFSNRLQADLFIHLNFFYKSYEPAECYIYYYSNNPTTDLWHQEEASWENVHSIYKKNLRTTMSLGTILESQLKKSFANTIALFQLRGIPFRPLLGLTAPALAIEFGITPESSLQNIVGPLATGIKNSIAKLTKDGKTDRER